MVAANETRPWQGFRLASALLAAAAALANVKSPLAATAKRELTPADAVATVRAMGNQASLSQSADSAVISPDGRRYVIRLVHGDLKRNGVSIELLTGHLDSLDSASHPIRCAPLLTTGLGSPNDTQGAEYDPYPTNLLRWVNDHEIAFLWSDAHQVRQVLSVDLNTCKRKFLTHSPTSVYAFGVASTGTLLINAKASPPNSAVSRRQDNGMTVRDSTDGWSVLRGDFDGASIYDVNFNNEWSILSASGSRRRVAIDGSLMDPSNPAFRELAISPNGAYAVTHAGMKVTPADWSRYSAEWLQSLIRVNESEPNRTPLRYVMIDLRRGTSRPLWDAPIGMHSLIAWAPGSDFLLFAPTFLPLTAGDSADTAGTAVAEVNASTGQYKRLPLDLTGRTVAALAWLSPSTVEIRTTEPTGADARIARFQRRGDRWEVAAQIKPANPAIRIETRQTLNSPPQLFAVDAVHGESRLILDLNPRLLTDFKLGRIERMSGTLPTGERWLGQLIYPADYVPGNKYPLVIQSLYAKAWGDEEFTLDGSWGASGMGLGPSSYPSYPGQLLATRNIAVLELEILHSAQGVKEPEDHQIAFETLARQLASSGLVDEKKVGLAGFSRNGYWVEYALAHSKFPFAAAIAADNYDPSYFQSALADWRVDDAEINGAPPFGAGLAQWMQRAPGFNAEHIQSPLLMIGQSGSRITYVIGEWEIFSRLRFLHRPVEIYVMPDIDRHPSHITQNPGQIVAIQARAIDWLSFWLTGREDTDPQKREQYVRWHALRTLRDSNIATGLKATSDP